MTFVPLPEWRELLLAVIKVEFAISRVPEAGIQQAGILLPDGEEQLVFEGVDLQIVPENVTMDREQQ